TDLSVSDDVADSIRAMVNLVNDRLSQIPYPPNYTVSKRWLAILNLALRLALSLRDPRHLAYASLAIFDVPLVVFFDAVATQISDGCEKTYYQKHPELRGIGDAPLARPGTTVMMDGVPYSTKTEQGFFFYSEIFGSLPEGEPTDVVVEVGSGFGRLARIMRLAGRTKCFVLVDLPESLLFAFAFLRINFPQAKTLVVSSVDDISEGIESEYDFIFCPIQLLAALRLQRVDLVINTYSFGEMTQGCVDYIMHAIHHVLRPRFLYSCNVMFSQKALHYSTGGLDGEANEVALNVEPIWRPIRFELDPSPDGESYLIAGSVVLQRVASDSAQELVRDMIHAASQVERG